MIPVVGVIGVTDVVDDRVVDGLPMLSADD